MNYFERFEIKRSYDIDFDELENQYFALQSRYHPDLVASLDEKQRYANIVMELNEGYKILKNDYLRADYLLKLENIDISDSKTNKVPSYILEAVWQNSEKLDQLSKSDDLDLFIEALEDKHDFILKGIAEAFKQEDYKAATIKTMQMKYCQNLMMSAKEKRRGCS